MDTNHVDQPSDRKNSAVASENVERVHKTVLKDRKLNLREIVDTLRKFIA